MVIGPESAMEIIETVEEMCKIINKKNVVIGYLSLFLLTKYVRESLKKELDVDTMKSLENTLMKNDMMYEMFEKMMSDSLVIKETK